MDQSELIAKYDEDNVQKFNNVFFNKTDNDIIHELKNIILSCQRSRFFTINVVSFTVVEDYSEITRLLYEYYENLTKNKNKSKKGDNPYDFINLKDSDIKLLIVCYYIEIKGESNFINVYIAVPRIVDKFYFRLGGSLYSAMYQLVDASTYNNTTSNAKKHRVTLKTILAAMRMYREVAPSLRTVKKENLSCVYYVCNVFNKSVPSMKYILAKYGFYGAQHFFHFDGEISISTAPNESDEFYSFCSKTEGVYINVPKYLYDNDSLIQSFVYTVLKSILKDTTVEAMYTNAFWLEALGLHFSNSSVDKGLSILDSIENIYDISTRESIRLPEEVKKDIYGIIKWMMGEFSNLRLKDNLDISTKRIRCAEYIASLYAMKLSKGIYRISDLGKRADIDSIRKSIVTNPMYLIGAMQKCKLINYRDMVNDKDSISSLKFTYKGIAGIGESSNSSVPNAYRSVNVSHIGRVDLNSSSTTDPGLSGMLCPLGKIYENGSFSEFEEPNYWDDEFAKTMETYRNLVGLKAIADFSDKIGLPSNIDPNYVNESISTFGSLIPVITRITDDIEVPLEEGGAITYGE